MSLEQFGVPTGLPSSTSTRTHPSILAFSPRAPIQILGSPRIRTTTAVATNMALPMGFSLIARGIGACKPWSNTVELLQHAIETIRRDTPELENIPVIVKPFSSRGDWVSTAYVHLDTKSLPKPATELEFANEPRIDLLTCWKEALEAHDSSWEVKWTPLNHGKDRRLWIRFGQLKEDSRDTGFQEKCETHLLAWAKQKGYPVTNAYFNAGGVTLCMACPSHVDEILEHSPFELRIPGVPRSLQPVRGRQIEIENAFELAITGLSDDYDQDHLHDLLRDWLVDTFAEDGATTLAGTRVAALEPDIFIIFHMTTWKATCEVLSKTSAERFKEDFKIYESMQPPQLLYNLNASGLGRRPGGIRRDHAQGDSVVVEGLDELRREFNTYKETNSQLQATQLHLATTTATLTTLTNTVNDMNNRFANTQRAILFQAQELSLNRAMMDLLETDEVKRQQMFILIESLEEEGNRLTMELSRTNTDFNALVQGAGRPTCVGRVVFGAKHHVGRVRDYSLTAS